MKDIYIQIQNKIHKNYENHNHLDEPLLFELPEGIEYSIFDFPVSYLLNITNNQDFLIESYFKILDRPIDIESFNILLSKLDNKTTTKEKIIKSLTSSKECKIKNTKLSKR